MEGSSTPCDTIVTSRVDLGAIGDRGLLVRALEGLGYAAKLTGQRIEFGSYRDGGTVHPDGRVELRGEAARLEVNQIKRAYSVEAVKLASAKFGWKLAATGENKFVAQRRF